MRHFPLPLQSALKTTRTVNDSPRESRSGRHGKRSLPWQGLAGAAAFIGLVLAVPACGIDATSNEAALVGEQAVAEAPAAAESDGPLSVDVFDLDGSTGVDMTKCINQKDGGPTSCKDEATWKSYGDKFCQSKMLSLHNVTFSNECGRGHYREAVYQCCEKAPTPPPPPPPPMCGCTHEKAGGGKDCKDRGAWKTEAEKACKAKGKTLSRIEYHDGCGCDSYRTIEFECCGTATPPPPPPPPMCFDGHEGAAGVCHVQDEWKKLATKACEAKGTKLTNISYGAPCRPSGGMTGYAEVKYQCCK